MEDVVGGETRMKRDALAMALATLTEAHQGLADLPLVARAIRQLPTMVLLYRPDDAAGFFLQMTTLPDAATDVRQRAQSEPLAAGSLDLHGRPIPYIFTSHEPARRLARERGLCASDGSSFTLESSWASSLQTFLLQGCAGAIIDPGSPHTLPLDRRALSRLLAMLTLDDFASQPEVWPLLVRGDLLVKRQADTGWAYMADSEAAARMLIDQLLSRGEVEVQVQRVTASKLMNMLRGGGVTRLVINPTLLDERTYEERELLTLLEGAEAADRTTEAAAQKSDGGLFGASPPAIAVKARQAWHPPPVPPPGHTAEDSRERLKKLYRQSRAETLPLWQLIETLAFDQDLHVPVYPNAVDGLSWPQMMRDPDRNDAVMAPLFTTSELARQAAAGGLFDVATAMAGVEAMRWIWSAPEQCTSIYVDWPEHGGWLRIPTLQALGALTPALHELVTLEQVPHVGLDRISTLAGARGGKPEVIKALVTSWRQLVGVEVGPGPLRPEVDFGGRRYLPAFTSPEAFLKYQPTVAGPKPRPFPASHFRHGQSLFRAWIEQAAALDGVLLDPHGSSPIALSAFDLAIVALWCEEPPRGVDVHRLFRTLGDLVEAGHLDTLRAARCATQWPSYSVCVQHGGEGLAHLIQVPTSGALAAFSTPDLALEFVQALVRAGAVRPDQVHVQPLFTRWGDNVFELARTQLGALWIDPSLHGRGGLQFDAGALEAAALQIDETFMPRVDGFVCA